MEQARYYVISDDALLLKLQADRLQLPSWAEICRLPLAFKRKFGRIADIDCFAAGFAANKLPTELPADLVLVNLRQLSGHLDEEHYRYAFRAAFLVNWLKTNRFCGCCQGEMADVSGELALQCRECGHTVYPRISPAIIVAVTKGSEILLARSSRFPAGRFSVIAGFLEPGETLEDCVRREVKEEVGIEVDSITYFGNQPWPFPDSQMIGFTARYVGGELNIDNKEIVAAGWFTADNLPDIPPKDSIARRLIDHFVATQHGGKL